MRGHADESNHRQNTPSAKTKTVKVYYPFHPLSGQELEVFTWYSTDGNAVTVLDRSRRSLKIPYWMLSIEAETTKLSPHSVISVRALLSLCELLEAHRSAMLPGDAMKRQGGSDDKATQTIQRRRVKRRARSQGAARRKR